MQRWVGGHHATDVGADRPKTPGRRRKVERRWRESRIEARFPPLISDLPETHAHACQRRYRKGLPSGTPADLAWRWRARARALVGLCEKFPLFLIHAFFSKIAKFSAGTCSSLCAQPAQPSDRDSGRAFFSASRSNSDRTRDQAPAARPHSVAAPAECGCGARQ